MAVTYAGQFQQTTHRKLLKSVNEGELINIRLEFKRGWFKVN